MLAVFQQEKRRNAIIPVFQVSRFFMRFYVITITYIPIRYAEKDYHFAGMLKKKLIVKLFRKQKKIRVKQYKNEPKQYYVNCYHPHHYPPTGNIPK